MAPVFCFAELVETGLWAVWSRATSTTHPISAKTASKERIDCIYCVNSRLIRNNKEPK